jgi:hypothetical protein
MNKDIISIIFTLVQRINLRGNFNGLKENTQIVRNQLHVFQCYITFNMTLNYPLSIRSYKEQNKIITWSIGSQKSTTWNNWYIRKNK